MLTLVLDPGGTARVVTIAEALLHFGVDIHRFDRAPGRTPEERRQRARRLARQRRRRVREEREAAK